MIRTDHAIAKNYDSVVFSVLDGDIRTRVSVHFSRVVAYAAAHPLAQVSRVADDRSGKWSYAYPIYDDHKQLVGIGAGAGPLNGVQVFTT